MWSDILWWVLFVFCVFCLLYERLDKGDIVTAVLGAFVLGLVAGINIGYWFGGFDK